MQEAIGLMSTRIHTSGRVISANINNQSKAKAPSNEQ
jgi:hypothetical protein